MKPTTTSVLLFAAMTIAFVAHADEQATKDNSTTTRSVEVIVESSSEKKDDSAPKTSVKGRIVIVGPDGKRQEYDLGESLPEGFKINVNDFPFLSAHDHASDTASVEPRYLIGVMCKPADNLLRRHLKLADSGLLASHISEGLPAATAGIQQDDILLAVGEQKLSFVHDLIKVVSASEGKEITIELLRDGDRISVAVTPKKLTGKERKDVLASLAVLHQHTEGANGDAATSVVSQIEGITNGTESTRVFLRSFGPGIRLDTAGGPQTRQQLLELIHGVVKKQDLHAAEAEASEPSDDNERSLKILQQQIEQLRKQIARIKQQMENKKGE
ncbi:MAG: PDZ domain-containing protein [Fuerstiella sp.]|nr:PDZ domain-containing protein [Fuerstiella sp.]MCP4853205.1 PDZ domain-containing protein [Fuerstiella sp.]